MKISGPIPIHDPRSATSHSLPARRPAADGTAFSLIEILAVVGLMSVIIIGLMAMFNQTQRAFRLGMTQTDVLEAGRMATDLLVRELEQVRPNYGVVDFNARTNSPNFYIQLRQGATQPLPGGISNRTNILTDLFFVTRENQTWKGVGYFIANTDVKDSIPIVGSLYRYETNQTIYQGLNAGWMYGGFNNSRSYVTSNISKVLDGIIHFRVRVYNPTNGWISSWIGGYDTNTIRLFGGTLAQPTDVNTYFFFSNSVPAYVELELGVVEPQIYERYKSLPTDQVRTNYLKEQVAHIHLFRQRIPIRNVDRSAYP